MNLITPFSVKHRLTVLLIQDANLTTACQHKVHNTAYEHTHQSVQLDNTNYIKPTTSVVTCYRYQAVSPISSYVFSWKTGLMLTRK